MYLTQLTAFTSSPFVPRLFPFSDATIYVGGLDDKVSESILWELFLQAGPVGKWMRLLF
jgi:RNA recognition motif-containing protein